MTRRLLTGIAIVYLVVPNLIFQIGYLRLEFAVPLLLLSGWSLAAAIRGIARECDGRGEVEVERGAWLWLCGGLAAWTCLAGVGGIGHQNPDWEKSNALLKDLVMRPWPVAYATDTWPEFGPGDFLLVYYFGYYLPAAIAGKLSGWIVANLVLFVWTWCGVVIAFALLLQLQSRVSIHAVRTMVIAGAFFGGWDLLGYLWLRGVPALGVHIDWWNAPWFQYPSMTSHLVWAPQHAVAGWVLTSLVLHALERRVGTRRLGLVASAALLTTPFAVVGVAPFLVAALVRAPRRQDWASIVSPENVLGVAGVGVPAAAFLSASAFSFPIQLLVHEPGFWLAWARLWILEVAIMLPLIVSAGPSVCLLSAATLMALPFWRMGEFNDLAMRASIPSVWMLFAGAMRVLLPGDAHPESGPAEPTGWGQHWRRVALIAVLVVGAAASVQELSRALAFFQIGRTWDATKVSAVLGPGTDARRLHRRQYQGDPDSPFFRWLSKPPIVVQSGQ